MASTLMQTLMGHRDEYGQRIVTMDREIARLQNPNSPFGRELQARRSFYIDVFNSAIKHMPAVEREDEARRWGQTIDNMFHLYKRNEEQKNAKQVAALVE